MRQMIPVDFSRLRAFCKPRGGLSGVSKSIGRAHDTLRKRQHLGTVSSLMLERIQELYGIPYRLFLPRTTAEEFLGWLKANPPPPPEPKKAPQSRCSDRCKKCKYRGDEILGEIPCLYILRTGKRRPCPAGPDCTEFKKGGRREYVSTRIL